MHGAPTSRSVARLPAAPLATIVNARPQGWVESRNVALNPPERVAFARIFFGPVRVNAVSVTCSPGSNAEPSTTSGCVPATLSRGGDAAELGAVTQSAATAAVRLTIVARMGRA